MYTHDKQIITAGVPVSQAKKALIMIHGRGASANSILSLADHLSLPADIAIIAPQATQHSWYPHSFMAPVENNEPALSSALQVIDEIVEDLTKQGIDRTNIYFLGFSQGACLTLEYVARHGQQYAGVMAFTGGLIGQDLKLSNYLGDFAQTPILIATGDPDPHVPISRVEETVAQLTKMNADVLFKVYNGRPHTVTQEELDLAEQHVLKA
ncbi:MAG: dienelactone hydrolase family protein [Bacteroidetes bacterium]|jgi:phospholipase/carboxylesterase|nr:dienelactone hydrolase family protein [Bacteroidota bacterium]